jgi:serine/threonine protein kinase
MGTSASCCRTRRAGACSSTRTPLARLGEGSFGLVRKNSHRALGELAAKITTDPCYIIAFITEAAVLRYLQGVPNIIQLLGITSDFVPAGIRYNGFFTRTVVGAFPDILIELADGTVKDVIKMANKRTISWPTLRNVAFGILQGYFQLYSRGIVHRDTKPENILYKTTASGAIDVRVADFGKAVYQSEFLEPKQDAYPGTYMYASPEAILRSLLTPSIPVTRVELEKHDAWSVGAVLYHLLMGKPLYSEKTKQSSDPRINVLYDILVVLGVPAAGDGYFSTRLHEQPTLSELIVGMSERTSLVLPRTTVASHLKGFVQGEFDEIVDIIEQFLEYNSVTRLSIPDAYVRLFGTVPEIHRPLLHVNINNTSIGPLDAWIVQQSRTMVWSLMSLPFVVDRACLYVRKFLSFVDEKNNRARRIIGAVALAISTALFSSGPPGETESDSAARIRHAIRGIADTTNEGAIPVFNAFFENDIPFLGRTYFDELCEESSRSLDAARFSRRICALGILNIVCHSYSFYVENQVIRQRIYNLVIRYAETHETQLCEFTKSIAAPFMDASGKLHESLEEFVRAAQLIVGTTNGTSDVAAAGGAGAGAGAVVHRSVTRRRRSRHRYRRSRRQLS